MKDLQPAVFSWSEAHNAMYALPQSIPLCTRQFKDGEQYLLSPKKERSVAAHRKFMAVVHEAFDQLPERYVERFKNPDHLRYWCLIACGFADEKTVLLDTETDAQKMVDYIVETNESTHTQVQGRVVRIWTAHSQRYDSMDGEEFLKTMQPVFDLLSDMIGTSVTELKKNAGKAA